MNRQQTWKKTVLQQKQLAPLPAYLAHQSSLGLLNSSGLSCNFVGSPPLATSSLNSLIQFCPKDMQQMSDAYIYSKITQLSRGSTTLTYAQP